MQGYLCSIQGAPCKHWLQSVIAITMLRSHICIYFYSAWSNDFYKWYLYSGHSGNLDLKLTYFLLTGPLTHRGLLYNVKSMFGTLWIWEVIMSIVLYGHAIHSDRYMETYYKQTLPFTLWYYPSMGTVKKSRNSDNECM